jgi:hypothetical protein
VKRTESQEKEEKKAKKSDEESSAEESQGKKAWINMATHTRSTHKKVKVMLIDSGANLSAVKTTEYVQDYVRQNIDTAITMRTASGHKLVVTHTGHVPGIGDTMVVPDISDNLLLAVGMLKNDTGVVMIPGVHPYAVLTTTRKMRIVVPLNGEDQFELPLHRLSDLISLCPRAHRRQLYTRTQRAKRTSR